MKLLHEQVIGGIVIAALVAVGLLITEEPELGRWLESPFLAPDRYPRLSNSTVSHMDWSADGRKLLSQSRGGDTAAHKLSIHDLNDGTGTIPTWVDALQGSISHASLSPDGSSVVLATYGGELWWVDTDTSAATELAKSSNSFLATAMGHDGQFMAGATTDGEVYLCEPTNGRMRTLLSPRKAAVIVLRFSAASERLLCARSDGSISVWETSSGAMLGDLAGVTHTPTAAAFLDDGSQVISLGGIGAIRIWNVDSRGEKWHGIEGSFSQNGIAAVDVDVSSALAAWGGGMSQRIMVWDLQTRQTKLEIENPSVVLCLKFSPDGSRLAVGGRESTIRIYDASNGSELRTVNIQRTMDSAEPF
jgi:WD40 repeat protein